MSALRYSTRAPVPLDALRLQEDIRDLEEARKHLNKVDPDSVCEERETGWNSIWCVQKMLRVLQRYAENKLRREYLAPTRKKIERARPRNV